MSTEIEQKALDMGWIPQAEFRGNPEKWVSAEKYVERSEEFIPFIKAENRQLKSQIDSLKGDLGSMKSLLTTTTEAMEALRKENSEINKLRVEQVRKQLVEEIAEARKADDVEKEEELRDKLDDVKAAQKVSSTKATVTPITSRESPATVDPDVREAWTDWINDNSWWNTNRGMRALSVDIANELAREGKITMDMPAPERFKKVGEATVAEWNKLTAGRVAHSKVESGKGSEGGGGGGPGPGPRHTFADLPADAKAGAASFEADCVGPNKKFKTVAEYRQHYTDKFYAQG